MSNADESTGSGSILASLGLLARWRAVPIGDAERRWRLVPIYNSNLVSRNRLELAVAIIVTLLVSIGGMVAGWYTAPLWCIPIMAALFALSTYDWIKPIGIAHRRLSIRDDQCPWCSSPLASIDQGAKRPCTRCPGQWWDVPGLEAGTSPRQHLRRRVGYTIVAVLVGLLLGLILYSVTNSMDFGVLMFVGLIVLALTLAAARSYAKHFVNPLVFAVSIVAPTIIGATARAMAADFTRLSLIVLLGVGAGAAALIAGQRGVRERPRDVIHGRGRECAQCGYDLRVIANGLPCPECGSYQRVR